MQKRTIVIGGDKRFDYLRKMLCNNDCFPADYLIENLHNFDKVVLPYPLSFDGNTLNAPSVDGKLFLSDIISSLSPIQTLFLGGKLPEYMWLRPRDKNSRASHGSRVQGLCI